MATTKKRVKRPVKFAKRTAITLIDPRVKKAQRIRPLGYAAYQKDFIGQFQRLSDHTQAASETAALMAISFKAGAREGLIAPKAALKAAAILKKARELDALVGRAIWNFGGEGSTKRFKR